MSISTSFVAPTPVFVPLPGLPPSTPPGIIGDPNEMFALAQEMVIDAEQYLSMLQQAAASLTPASINPTFPQIDTAPKPITLNLPALQTIAWTSPVLPADFTGTLNTDGLLPAAFTGTAPALSFGTAPTFSESLPPAPGVDLNFTYPTANVQLPAVPALLSLSTVTFGGVNLPTFSATTPILTAVAPSIDKYVPGAAYTSTLLTTLRNTLLDRITNGTNMTLSGATQQAIFDAAREREFRKQADALADLDQMEMLGYALPPGVWVDARLKLQNNLDATASGLSRDIMVEQDKMLLENVKLALAEANALEGKLLDIWNLTEQRTFEATKYVTEAGVQIYNAQVQAFGVLMEAYKTAVQVYQAEIQAQQMLVEVYKAEIEAERVKAEINNSIVQMYKAQVEAAISTIEIFKAQVQLVQTQAEVEKIKVEIFGAQVQAFASEVNAYTAEIEGYKAGVEVEATKQTAFKSQVEAYSAQVEAGAKAIDAKVAVFKGQLDQKTQQLEAYKAQLQGMIAQVQATNVFNQSTIEGYKAEVGGITSYNDTLTKQWQATIEVGEKIAEVAVKAAEANGQLYISSRSLSLDASKVGAQVTAQLGASALNAIHWSSSYSNGYSNSNSYATSLSSSVSNSVSQSFQESQSQQSIVQSSNSNINEQIASA